MPRMESTLYEPEHDAFRDAVRSFCTKHIAPHHAQWEEDGIVDRSLWVEAGKQGLLGTDVPEQYGGGGIRDFRYNCVVSEEVTRVGGSGVGFTLHNDVMAPYLLDLTTDEQKARWLPPFVTGEMITAIAMSEPGAGSDLQGLTTSARRDGTDWVINGSKTFITNGFSADLVVTAVRTNPEKGARGITLFGIEATDEGFSRGRKLDKVGQTESDTSELFFENVRLGDDRVIGEIDNGFIFMMERLPQERLGAAVSNIAHAKQILEETIRYAKDRQAFGQPIGKFQHNKFLMAELVTKIEVAEAYVDKGVEAHMRGELTAIDAAKAKWWSAEIQNDVLDHCVQLHGGYGFMNEYRVARAWRDARVTKIWAGSNEIMKELIGRDLGF